MRSVGVPRNVGKYMVNGRAGTASHAASSGMPSNWIGPVSRVRSSGSDR